MAIKKLGCGPVQLLFAKAKAGFDRPTMMIPFPDLGCAIVKRSLKSQPQEFIGIYIFQMGFCKDNTKDRFSIFAAM